MSFFPQRQFNGTPGEPSADIGGPDMIERDIDEINKMFNPESTHSGGQPGGISPENLNFGILDLGGIAQGTGIKYLRLNSDNAIEVSTDGEHWTVTGSSGHLIYDKNGTLMTQRTRLKFANSTVTDDGTTTIVNGIKGDKGDKGDTGSQGPTGSTGAKGDKGDQGKVWVPSISSEGVISWTLQDPPTTPPSSRNIRGPQGVQGTQGATGATGPQGPQGIQGIQGIQGPKGDDGLDGTSFTLKGIYATLEALITAHPTGSEGDAYAVGTSTENTIYNWDVDRENWVNIGSLQGPQGPQGEQGIPGIQGPEGPEGPQGDQGIQGPQGVQGPEGPEGPRGYPANVNGVSPDSQGNITIPTVNYTAQSLTSAQQAQARNNIGALGDLSENWGVKLRNNNAEAGGTALPMFVKGQYKNIGASGWYRIATVTSFCSFIVHFRKDWNGSGPGNATIAVSLDNNGAHMGVLTFDSNFQVQFRLVKEGLLKYHLELYIASNSANSYSINYTGDTQYITTVDFATTTDTPEYPVYGECNLSRSGWYAASAPMLIWTNSSPTSSFAAQEINMNLSDCSRVKIDFLTVKTTPNDVITLDGAPGERILGNVFLTQYSNSAARRVEITTNKVIFSDASRFASYGNSGTINNDVLIPYRIYGIR